MQTEISQNHSLKYKYIIKHLQADSQFGNLLSVSNLFFPFRFNFKENIYVTEA